MARPRKAAAPAVPASTVLVEGVWPHVFTGMSNPARVEQGEVIALPAEVAEVLIAAGAVKRG